MSAEQSARTIRQADGLDSVRALQRVLYRSAKQNRTRRFHALYDKLTRFDVMQRAWSDVARNQGAPGIDKVSITDISSRGPESIQTFIVIMTLQTPSKYVMLATEVVGTSRRPFLQPRARS